MVAQIDRDYLELGPSKVLRRLAGYALEGRQVTTRGRWANPAVAALLGLGARLCRGRQVASPIFILGMGRSGTTVLGSILSAHGEVGYLNEPKLMWHLAVPRDDIVGNYASTPGLYRMTACDVSDESITGIRAMYAFWSLLSGAARVVDKYPEMIFRLPLLEKIFPDARFVAIVRDGRDVIHSVAGWNVRNTVHKSSCENWWGKDDIKWELISREAIRQFPDIADNLEALLAIRNDRERSKIEWIMTMEEILRHAADGKENFRVIKYEDVVRSPRAALGELLSFCRLSHDESLYAYAEKVLQADAIGKEYQHDGAESPVEKRFNHLLSRLGYIQ